MAVLVCPRCREPYAGQVGAGWLTCSRCQHRWLPTASPAANGLPVASALPIATPIPVAPTTPAATSIPIATPIPVAVPLRVAVAVPLPPSPPTVGGGPDKSRGSESDEYAPNESGEMKRRTAALTNRQAAEVAIDPSTLPAATPVAAGTDPFDPDLFERMAREAQAHRPRSNPDQAVASAAPPKERTIPSRQINCPVCGHGYPSTRPDDATQACPQCQTTFNLAKGHVVSGGAKVAGGDPLIGRVLRGCLIDRKVGEGGMGSVYHARQLSLERSVAVKVLPPELARNRNFITRFEREAKSLARINHPNILHIYDFGEDQQLGIYFMIIEFVEGRDVGDLLHECYTLGQVEVLDIVRQAAMGLEQAAEKGVIHRDIKPDNLMLTKEGICKVSDFGLAKATTAEKEVTTIGVRVGTPAFMSPEQCDGDDVDFRSDIYNLGCTAFLALTGQLPYDADTPFAIMLKHKNDPVPSPRSFNPNLDSRVERMVMRMIAKRPADRFDSLRELVELVEDLEVKLAGTSTVLRKTRGPFRAMSDMEAVEHARMTSSGTRVSPMAGQIPGDLHVPALPVAKAASTPAPIGQAAVPDWLKPVEEPKTRKTTSNLHPMPTPRTLPQAGTTSQRELKDLRSKLTEARHRNMLDEAQTLAAEGDRLAANGQLVHATEAWTRAATITPNAAEAQSLLQRASKARRGHGVGKLFKRVVVFCVFIAGCAAAAFYGVPVGHNLIAEREVEPLRAIASPTARLAALESFVATYGKSLELYYSVFNQGYPVLAADQATSEIAALKKQLAPPPLKVEPPKPNKADEAMKRLESLRDDPSVPWLSVANEARRVSADSEVKIRAAPILIEAESQLAAMAADYETIRTRWASGHQQEVAVLSAEFRAKHPRAGTAAPAALPGRLVVVDGDSGTAPADLQITTRIQLSDGGDRGVFAGDSKLAPGESAFCRFPRSAVTVEIVASGYRTELIQVPANGDAAEQVIQVRLHVGEAWSAQIGKSPRWLSLTPLANSPFALVRTPDHLALVRLATGELRSPLTRSQASLPVGSDGAFWTDCLDPRAGGFAVGTTDGLAVELLVDDGAIRLGALLHRGVTPVLAFKDKDLTFQAKRGMYAITAVEQGMLLSARTSDKDLWTASGLAGFQRPMLWSQDDRILVLDDRRLQAMDEADGHIVAPRPLPGVRTGAAFTIPNSSLLVIPTAAGASLMRIQVMGEGTISEVDDNALAEARARMVAQEGSAFLTAAQDKSLRLLTWNGTAFHRAWSATVPHDDGQPTWLTLTPDFALVGDDRGTVFMMSRADGTLQRRITHRSPLLCPPLIADGRLIVGDRDGNLTAYHLPPLPTH